MRLFETWKRAVMRAERDLVRGGLWFALVDVVAALSACFVPLVSPLLSFGRIAMLVILVPALLRTLAIRHADRPDADLLKAIAIAVGVAAFYVALRTWLVVQVCSV